MGLDVYLYKYDDIEAVKKRRDAYEQASTDAWRFADGRDYNSLTEIEKESARAAVQAKAIEIGLGEDGNDPQEHKIEQDSRLYPEHMFKVGYFRSSYNEGGFNRVMPPICGSDLNDLFPDHEQYEFQPDWANSRVLAIAALERARDWLKDNGAYQVSTFSNNMFTPSAELPATTEAAMALFTEELKRSKEAPSDFESYSRAGGTFFFKQPMEVIAVIEGTGPFKQPCAYVVYKAGDNYEWYLHALEIVIETCEYVLDQPDKDKFWLHWSG